MRKTITILLTLVFAITAAHAQDDGERKLTKKERKALRQRADSLRHDMAFKAISDTAFVIEADEVVFKRGYTAHVTPSTNFVAVCGGEAVVQVAFNVPWPGFNGMGGITLEGRITKYEAKTDKKGNLYVQFGVTGRAISAHVFVTLWNGNNKATLNIQHNFRSGRITLNGVAVPPEESNIFKGSSL